MDDQERLQEARDQFYVSNFDHCAELAEGEKYTRNEWITLETSGEDFDKLFLKRYFDDH
jgi:hypothetical protein